MTNIPQNITTNLNLVLNNKFISCILAVLLAMYSGIVAPKLPKYISVLAENFFVKLIWIFLIIYLSSDNPLLSILLSLGILLTIQTLVSLESTNNLVQSINSNNNEIPLQTNEIPLSPMRVKIMQDAVNKINIHQNQAKIALDNNNKELVNYCNNEINKQNIIIQSLVNAKKALLLAKDAESMQDTTSATHYINEVKKNNIKIISLLNSEDLKIKAEEAKTNGDINTYNKCISNAFKEENKINIINKADEIINLANDALAANEIDKSDALIKEAVKLYESLNTSMDDADYLGNELDNSYGVVSDNTNIDNTPIPDLLENNKNLTEYKVEGYAGPDYPSY